MEDVEKIVEQLADKARSLIRCRRDMEQASDKGDWVNWRHFHDEWQSAMSDYLRFSDGVANYR